MTRVLLEALGRCRVEHGPLRCTGVNENGEVEARRPVVVHAPRSWFTTKEAVARALMVQNLAVEAVPREYLRSLLAAVLDAESPLAAAEAALAAGIPVVVAASGMTPWKSVRTPEEAARLFTGESALEPVFPLEEVVAGGRLKRCHVWRSGSVIEVPAS